MNNTSEMVQDKDIGLGTIED